MIPQGVPHAPITHNQHVPRFESLQEHPCIERAHAGPRGAQETEHVFPHKFLAADNGAAHTGHVHPHSVISGTVYVSVLKGASALKLEDPRLPLMMAAPTRTAEAPEALQTFVTVAPEPGTVLMWESWLRHEVTAGTARAERISLSFNYA